MAFFSRGSFVQDTVAQLESSNPEVAATLVDLASTMYPIGAAGEVTSVVTGSILSRPTHGSPTGWTRVFADHNAANPSAAAL
eukprot:SAG31_NODE_29057_length_401_cov_1.172185_1_plen_81_part_10